MKVITENFRLYSISVAAKMLGVGRDTLLRLIDTGKIGFIQTLKRKKIAHIELERLMEMIILNILPKLVGFQNLQILQI